MGQAHLPPLVNLDSIDVSCLPFVFIRHSSQRMLSSTL
jgi:hypothetical protein